VAARGSCASLAFTGEAALWIASRPLSAMSKLSEAIQRVNEQYPDSQSHKTMKTTHAISITILLWLSCACRADDTLDSLLPKDYADLHIVASNPKDPRWPASMRRLTQVGDGFTLEHLKMLDAQNLDSAEKEILKKHSLGHA